MLRVGLTGDLGSGKSTVAEMLATLGAVVFSSDEMARAMMQPGAAVFTAMVERFGPDILTPEGSLDRRKLAQMAFADGRVEELNALVHPAVLREQARLLDELAREQPHAIAVVESALIFTATEGAEHQPWRKRFDCIVLVRAPLEDKMARFVARLSAGSVPTDEERTAMQQDARARLALQTAHNEAHAADCLMIENSGNMDDLRERVGAIWEILKQAERLAG